LRVISHSTAADSELTASNSLELLIYNVSDKNVYSQRSVVFGNNIGLRFMGRWAQAT